jgi:hypothetical protein
VSAVLELAARCEAAAGPDQELDGAIDRLFNNRPNHGDYDHAERAFWLIEGANGRLVRSDGSARGYFCPASYTSSLDAAMKLVPDSYDWIVGDVNGAWGGTPYACVGSKEEHFAATAILALCAAALRAHAAMEANNAR